MGGETPTPVSPKAGYQTTELGLALVPMILGILMLTGTIDPANVDKYQPAVADIVAGAMVVLPPIGYAISRGLAKLGWIK